MAILEAIPTPEGDKRRCLNIKTKHSLNDPKYIFNLGEDKVIVLCRKCAAIITKQFLNYIKAE